MNQTRITRILLGVSYSFYLPTRVVFPTDFLKKSLIKEVFQFRPQVLISICLHKQLPVEMKPYPTYWMPEDCYFNKMCIYLIRCAYEVAFSAYC